MVQPMDNASNAVATKPRSLGSLLLGDDDPVDSAAARRLCKDAVRRFLRAIAAGDMAELAGSSTPDIVYEFPFSESGSVEHGAFRVFSGIQHVIELWTENRGARIHNAGPKDVEISVLGDGSRLFIEQRGDLTMADGRPYRNRYVFRFDIRDGKVAYVREYFNPIISAYAFKRPVVNGVMIETVPGVPAPADPTPC